MQDYQQDRKIAGASGEAGGGFGTTTSQPATGSFGATGQPQFATGTMSGPKLAEELVRKSLLGEELVNTQFHLFSARSSLSGQVMKPRVLCANNDLLAKSSKYFLDRE